MSASPAILSTFALTDLLLPVVALSSLLVLTRYLLPGAQQYTRLQGPPRFSWIYGYDRLLLSHPAGQAELYEAWQARYGDVFSLPAAVGGERVVLMDPRGLGYVLTGNCYGWKRPEG